MDSKNWAISANTRRKLVGGSCNGSSWVPAKLLTRVLAIAEYMPEKGSALSSTALMRGSQNMTKANMTVIRMVDTEFIMRLTATEKHLALYFFGKYYY
jgi:hypothetical protein